jgi:hypothetical protein
MDTRPPICSVGDLDPPNRDRFVPRLTRRSVVLAASSAALTAGADPSNGAPEVLNVVNLGADPSGKRDSSAAMQVAIDRLTPTGGVIHLPAGTYRVDQTLNWVNPGNSRRSGIAFVGAGMHSTIVQSRVAQGPLLRIRGIPLSGPISTTFFWGGGIQNMTLDGSLGAATDHDALEMMGWWYAELKNLRIMKFSRHGIRTVTDLQISANPDFSASTALVKATWIERCGGWGFKDDGGPQGSPAWEWNRVVFVFCAAGGAYVQSSSSGFTKCSFSQCGWSGETSEPSAGGYGLYFDGALTASSRHWVEGCEFDNNLSAHIGLRFASSSSFVNNRFIFHDRQGIGHLCPRAGIEIASGDARAAVQNVDFRQNFFRFDRGGVGIGYHWRNLANVRAVLIERNLFSTNGLKDLVLHRSHGAEATPGVHIAPNSVL